MKASFLINFLFSLCFLSNGQVKENDIKFNFDPPPKLKELTSKEVWITRYYIHSFNSQGLIPFLDKNGKELGLFADTCNYCKASLEGTVLIKKSDGTKILLNFDTRSSKSPVNCRDCEKFKSSTSNVEDWGKVLWKKTKGFGKGVKNYNLVPFRTVAVDNDFIPYGTILFIPSIRGISIDLPSGKKLIHDGYFFAGDTGSALKGNHIDLFTGPIDFNPFGKVINSNPNKLFKIYLVTDKSIINNISKQHNQ